jgi:sugar phosphate isomerase/epimerase
MFTVRDHIKDLPAVLKLIQSIGYASIEGYPLIYTRPARELKELVHGLGLEFYTGHFDYATLDEKLDYASELGLKTVICPWLEEPMRTTEGYQQAVKKFNHFTEIAAQRGIEFGYHFHNYDFHSLGKERGFDVLMRELDPRARIELDVFWVTEAGEDPIALMRKHASRLRMIHVKDRAIKGDYTTIMNFDPKRMTEAGKGTIDWPPILREARKLGVKEYYVDQDFTALPIEDCLRQNWEYLSGLAI